MIFIVRCQVLGKFRIFISRVRAKKQTKTMNIRLSGSFADENRSIQV
ncbi:Uncharacterized protein dnm_073680 [Desulfonema magnum]|uniref:Uncharacterized protein n=1 Tax=Desulfonema magnum TaxID=45655 RepID=A0A975GRR7_9BACT|nr:Uncharacterized protein dnm_073680 [Desulfonema magnum]